MPYFDDDGTGQNSDLIPKPSLCIGCVSDEADDEMERILCTLTRLDQRDEDAFICHAFRPEGFAATPSDG